MLHVLGAIAHTESVMSEFIIDCTGEALLFTFSLMFVLFPVWVSFDVWCITIIGSFIKLIQLWRCEMVSYKLRPINCRNLIRCAVLLDRLVLISYSFGANTGYFFGFCHDIVLV